MPLNVWPFNIKAKKLAKVEADKKRKRKKIFLSTLIPVSALILGGAGVGLYFILKPKKSKPEPAIEGFNMTGTNWKGYTSGNLTITTSNDEAIIEINNSYNAKNLFIPDQVTDGKKVYNLTDISAQAFSGCTTLVGHLTIGNNVINIGNNAFYHCTKLTGLTIGESVEDIGIDAFSGCTKITGALTIPGSVISIGNLAFATCSFNGNLIIGNHVNSIGTGAFQSCSGFIGNLTIPDSVNVINSNAFASCSGINGSLTLGNGVSTIGSSAFQNCQFTGELNIPDNVTTVGNNAFSSCRGLTGLNLNHLAVLGSGAFQGCRGLTHITGSYDGNPWGSSSAIFNNCDGPGIVTNLNASYTSPQFLNYLKANQGLPSGQGIWTT